MFYGDRRSGSSGSVLRFARETMADARSAVGDVERFSALYAPLIERANRAGGATRTPLEADLVRALFWYRSGRWQPDPIRRLLDHYVALEHLFTGGREGKDAQVADGVSRLYGSWQFRRSQFSIAMRGRLDTARQLSALVRSNEHLAALVDAEPNRPHGTRDWRTDLRPWLMPPFVRTVRDFLPVGADRDAWNSHLASLERLADGEHRWAAADGKRSDDARFRCAVLAQRRHTIVHEALTTAPGIALEADALSEVVEDVLGEVAESLLVRPDVATSMGNVLAGLAPPWVS